MKNDIAVTPLSASMMAAPGGRLPVRPAIAIRPPTPASGGRRAFRRHPKGPRNGLGTVLHHRFTATKSSHSRLQTSSHAPRLHSIPITEDYVAV